MTRRGAGALAWPRLGSWQKRGFWRCTASTPMAAAICGKSQTSSSGPSHSTTARKIVFSSWRTLPGQLKRSSSSAGLRASGPPPACSLRPRSGSMKWRASGGMSPARSRSAGTQDRKHVEAVIKVFAETAFARQFRQVAVGGGDDAHVDLHRPLGADGIDFAFLQRAQQLDLHVEAQFADFVEEQRAAVGFLEFAQMLVAGAGERALLVAEQDGFDQVLRNGAAIDGDERLAGAFRRALDGAGDQFLAGAGFAFDQDRNVDCAARVPRRNTCFISRRLGDQVVEGEPVVAASSSGA